MSKRYTYEFSGRGDEPLRELGTMRAVREREIAKYRKLYRDHPGYRMSPARMLELKYRLMGVDDCATWLDVGCGRGETVELAKGFVIWNGCDAVPQEDHIKECVLPDLPYGDDSYHLVTCLDVLEHLPEEDWEETVRNLGRVTKKRLWLAISNEPDSWGKVIDTELHITRLPYPEISVRLHEWLADWTEEGLGVGNGCMWYEFVR